MFSPTDQGLINKGCAIEIPIPDGVGELCEWCFFCCEGSSRATFDREGGIPEKWRE